MNFQLFLAPEVECDLGSERTVFLAAHGKDTDPALLTRLRDIQRPLHLRSESNLEGPGPVAGGISLKGTTTRGILLDISKIRCLRADLVIVDVQKDDCTGTGGAYGTSTLHRLEGHWTVVEWKIDRYS